jgi:hypothetical protein
MIKVLALMGSPRKGGNSDILADEVLKGTQQGGAEIEKVYLDDFLIRPIGEVCDNSVAMGSNLYFELNWEIMRSTALYFSLRDSSFSIY